MDNGKTLPKVGDTVLYLGRMPRVIERVEVKRMNTETKKEETVIEEKNVGEITLAEPIPVQVVVVNPDDAGKQIGIRLPDPPKNHRWYDAHECDGNVEMGMGWYIHPDSIVPEAQVANNPQTSEASESPDEDNQ